MQFVIVTIALLFFMNFQFVYIYIYTLLQLKKISLFRKLRKLYELKFQKKKFVLSFENQEVSRINKTFGYFLVFSLFVLDFY